MLVTEFIENWYIPCSFAYLLPLGVVVYSPVQMKPIKVKIVQTEFTSFNLEGWTQVTGLLGAEAVD